MAYSDRQVEDKILEGVRVYCERPGVKITAETIEVLGEPRRAFALNSDDAPLTICPMAGVDDIIAAAECGILSIEDAIDHAIRRLIAAIDEATEYMTKQVDNIVTEENLKSGRITFMLVGKESNEDMLELIPHGDFLDLAYTYRLIAEDGSYALITNQHVEKYGLDEKTLYERAKRDTRGIMTIASLESVAKKMAVKVGDTEALEQMEEWSKSNLDRIPMYIIGCTHKEGRGAAAMMYTDIMDAACMLCGCPDIYIIPSSLDEVLTIPMLDGDYDEGSRNYWKAAIRDVNKHLVEEQGIMLSNSLYSYNYKTKEYKIW